MIEPDLVTRMRRLGDLGAWLPVFVRHVLHPHTWRAARLVAPTHDDDPHAPGRRRVEDRPRLLCFLGVGMRVAWGGYRGIAMRAGDCLAVPPGVAFREFLPAEDEPRSWHLLAMPYGEDVYCHVGGVHGDRRLEVVGRERYRLARGGQLAALIDTCGDRELPERLRRDALALALRLLAECPRSPVAPSRGGDFKVIACENLVEERFADPAFGVAAMARALRCNADALSRHYKHVRGTGLLAHLRRRRILEAKHLLVRTADPIAAVAARCGFASRAAFSRSFKDLTGDAPSEFRRFGNHQPDVLQG